MAKTRISEVIKYYSVQLFSNQAVSSSRLFLSNFSKLLGSTDLQLGIIQASGNLSVFLSSIIFSRRTDIEGSKRYLHIGLFLSSITVAFLFFANNFDLLLSTNIINGLAMGMYPSALVAYVFGKRVRLGRFSSFGALGAGVGLLAAGFLVEYLSLQIIFVYSSVIFMIAFLISITLPPIPQKRHQVPLFPTDIFKRNLPIFLSYLIRHIAANVVWIIYPLYLVNLDLSYFSISILYMINPFLQFVLMYTVTDRLSSNLLLTLGLLFSATAFSTMYLSTTAWHIIPVQLLIAASWSCLYVGALREVTEGDVRKSTTTGLLNSIIYLGNIVGPLIGGFISEFIGNYKGNMLLAACMIFPTVPFYVLISRKKSNT